MKRALILSTAIALLLATFPAWAGTKYGTGVTVEKATPVSELFDKPAAYSGKTVKVTGLVLDVCTARGCWLELAGDRKYERIRVKVEDGAIVFPPSARGKQAAVQGVVQMMKMCPDEALRFRQKEAKEKGVPFDRSMITGKEAALSLQATGAVID